jgi:hypothetical protein
MCDLCNEAEVARAVLDYLVRHPQASDTLIGIADWWLTEHRARVLVSTLERALTHLQERGLIEAVGDSSDCWYRLKR